MISLYELSLLARAAYESSPTVEGWVCTSTRAGGMFDGFQGATFTKGQQTVVAFRGTTGSASDVVADLKLGVGMNTSHFSEAEEFVNGCGSAAPLVCGHSLGGAIAQIVGNRRSLKFATFNAPGVAVVASRNMLDATPGMLALRLGGAAVSMVRHPFQAARDIAATFNRVTGVNVCLAADVVSAIGVHYGNVVRIPGTGSNPLSQHGIDTVVQVLATNPVGRLDIDALG